MTEITKSYEARDVETKWYAAWQEAKCFAGHAAPANPGSRQIVGTYDRHHSYAAGLAMV